MDAQLQKQITAVQSGLGKFVKKPPLVEKHLSRPPFRFLHDIFISVMHGTGFYQGLFTPAEIDSSALNSKEEKTQFLQKVISVTGLVTGENVEAKVSKILAGQDPEKTLDLLILLGRALEKGLSSKDYVGRVLGGDTVEKKKIEKDTKNTVVVKEKKSSGASTKVKDAGKKNSHQQVKGSSSSSTNQKAGGTRQNEKEKNSNSKTNSNSKAKPSPVSKGTKTSTRDELKDEDNDVDLEEAGSKKRDRSRSRSTSNSMAPSTLRRGSTDKGKSKTETKESQPTAMSNNDNLTQKNSKDGQRSSRRESTENESEKVSVSTNGPPPPPDSEIFVKNEEDSVQFMGEVESLLQEHGIQIEDEGKRKASAIERKKSSTVRNREDKTTSRQVKAEVIDDDDDGIAEALPSTYDANLLIDDPHISQHPLQSQLTVNKSMGPVESDVDSGTDDNADVVGGMAKSQPVTAIEKQPEVAPNEVESGRFGGGGYGRPPSSFIRPSSARPAPPRPKTAVVEEEVPYRPPMTKIPMILDSEEIEEEETLDERKQGLLNLLTTSTNLVPGTLEVVSGEMNGNVEGKGHLVEQIIETKRDLEYGDKSEDEDDMRNSRMQTQAELEKLKVLIQKSARLANPLGRLLDFLQEDMEAMTSDYVNYKAEGRKLKELLEKEKEVTRERLKPLRRELMDLMDKMEQQNYEIGAAHSDLQDIEEHLKNYMVSIESGPDQVDIPRRFLIRNEWEFDMDLVSEELEHLEQRSKPRRGPFGEYPSFLCVSADAREQEDAGGKVFNIPKPKRKPQQQPGPTFGKREPKIPYITPTFVIQSNGDENQPIGFFLKGQKRQFESEQNNQFLEPPDPQLNSLEILSDNDN